jgi:hypothetical protein
MNVILLGGACLGALAVFLTTDRKSWLMRKPNCSRAKAP